MYPFIHIDFGEVRRIPITEFELPLFEAIHFSPIENMSGINLGVYVDSDYIIGYLVLFPKYNIGLPIMLRDPTK